MRAVWAMVAGVAVILAGCGKAPKVEADPAPTPVAKQTFNGCTWQKVAGDKLSIWAYACGPDSNNIHLVADNTLPGFALVGSLPGSSETFHDVVIRTFAKAEAAPIEDVLPQVRNLSPGPDTETCAFVPALDPTDEHSTRQLFELAPTGAAKAKWDSNVKTGEDGTPPCGDMGVSFAGSRVFEVMKDDPSRVVYIDYGSEIQIFDTATLKALK